MIRRGTTGRPCPSPSPNGLMNSRKFRQMRPIFVCTTFFARGIVTRVGRDAAWLGAVPEHARARGVEPGDANAAPPIRSDLSQFGLELWAQPKAFAARSRRGTMKLTLTTTLA